ncbi:MAG TPA: CoB--CoM heterodisulfide reductase subunit B, partial [Candidatus Methanoperedenaceae archaeon]|nr:CoB--CoM heterodisulfide reductase subunit B [Candidatus Methanoperedenaceae archaeon]
MKVSLFWGCLVPNRYPGIEAATGLVLDKLDIGPSELEGASCCPAPGLFQSFNRRVWLALSARNLSLAEEQGDILLTVCNGCFASLYDANELMKDEAILDNANKLLAEAGRRYSGNVSVRHITEFLYKDVGVEKIRESVEKRLALKAAVHYGCHLLRPRAQRKLGSIDRPVFFDRIVEATGASSIEWEGKIACCGAGGGVRSAMGDVALEMTEYKLRRIKKAGADCIVDACPFCHLQFDVSQKELSGKGVEYRIPVLHLTQLLAVAFGADPVSAGLDQNMSMTEEFL